MPAKNVKELIDYAKANPGKLNCGSSGNNTLQHFAGEIFNHMAGVKIVHIPYKGTGPAMTDLLVYLFSLLVAALGGYFFAKRKHHDSANFF